MKTTNQNLQDIPGYGMDADPENEPTYPMKNYTGDDHNRINYERSERQPADIELLMSTERPALPAVFGTSAPPSGLSGMIRRYAFKHSEDRYRHWIPLILADRINVVEGVLDDLAHGKLPNYFAESGFKSSWTYNRKGVIRKAVVTAVVAAAVVALIRRSKR